MSDRCNFYFGLFFALPRAIFCTFSMCTKNYYQMYGSGDMVRSGRTDGRLGGRTEKVKEMGAPPNDCLRKTQQKDSS